MFNDSICPNSVPLRDTSLQSLSDLDFDLSRWPRSNAMMACRAIMVFMDSCISKECFVYLLSSSIIFNSRLIEINSAFG